MEWVFGIVGVLLGAIAAYLVLEKRWRAEMQQAQTAGSVAQQRCDDLGQRLAAMAGDLDKARYGCTEAEKQCATLAAELKASQQHLAEQKKLLDEAQVKLRDAFANVSAEALARNNEAFLQLARERFATQSAEAAGSLEKRKAEIETLLKPMQELLATYQQRLQEIERSRLESYSMLREQLGVLSETQRTLNTQTGQLVSALRRPTTRGQWGEITLRRLVELAGMSNRCDFFEQATVTDDQGGRLRPDMVVRLPGGHEIVVDCKTTLDAFLDAAAATDDDLRRSHMLRHSQQVRSRARDLCGKSYWSQFKNTPEYVVMFLPGESFYASAVEVDASLYEDCLKSHVIVATPTTLLAMLKTVAHIWKQHDIGENAEQIRQLGCELYERLGVMAGHFAKLGDSLGTVISHYNATVGSMESRVMVSARKIGELGARTEKGLPELQPVDSRPREALPA